MSSSTNPSTVLHRRQSRPRTVPMIWSWSTPRFLDDPQTAHMPFCLSNKTSYSSWPNPYFLIRFLFCILSTLAARHRSCRFLCCSGCFIRYCRVVARALEEWAYRLPRCLTDFLFFLDHSVFARLRRSLLFFRYSFCSKLRQAMQVPRLMLCPAARLPNSVISFSSPHFEHLLVSSMMPYRKENPCQVQEKILLALTASAGYADPRHQKDRDR